MSKIRLAIIVTAWSATALLRIFSIKADAEQFDITVFCERTPQGVRPCAPVFYFSHHTAEELSGCAKGFYEKTWRKSSGGRTRYHHQSSGKSDPLQRRAYGFYDKLIAGDGSYPWIP